MHVRESGPLCKWYCLFGVDLQLLKLLNVYVDDLKEIKSSEEVLHGFNWKWRANGLHENRFEEIDRQKVK